MAAFLRKYATATTAGTHIGIPMIKAGSRDFATNADWTPAAGDVKVSIDGGAQANIGTLPTYSNGQWLFQFSAAELTGRSIRVSVVDSATKAVDDQFFIVETYGHASALHPFDLSQPMSNQSVASVTGAVGSLTNTGNIALKADVTAAQNAIVTHGDSEWAALPALDSGLAQGGTATTITLAATASSVNGHYVGQRIVVGSEAPIITGYVGASRQATVHPPFQTIPSAGTPYDIEAATAYLIASESSAIAAIQSGLALQSDLTTLPGAVWDESQSGHTTAGTFGAYLDAPVSSVSTGGVSAAAIADAVLDELVAEHASAGSLGKVVADIQSTAFDPATDPVTVGAMQPNVVNASALAADAVAEIQSGLATQASVDSVDGVVDTILAAVNALNDLDAATVKAQLVAALATDLYPELTAVPAADAPLADKLTLLAMAVRNGMIQNDTTATLLDDNGLPLMQSAVSDDGTTFTSGKLTDVA